MTVLTDKSNYDAFIEQIRLEHMQIIFSSFRPKSEARRYRILATKVDDDGHVALLVTQDDNHQCFCYKIAEVVARDAELVYTHFKQHWRYIFEHEIDLNAIRKPGSLERAYYH